MILTLNLKAVYFDQIKSGCKKFEYRVTSKYWRTRLDGRQYTEIKIRLGYPKSGDKSREITRPWLGYEIQKVQHELFGTEPVEVFAIRVN